ncbi:MAG: glycosyltransferase [Acidobacteriota bacterium]
MTSPSNPSVSIIIPSWNGRMLLEEIFPSLLLATKEFSEKTGGVWEVIVVDDGSVDDTIPWIETIPEKRIKLITRRRNSGFALACNLGFSACHHRVVVLLNNDVLVDRDFLLPLSRHFEDPRVFAVAFKALGRDQQTFCNGGKIGEFKMGFWKAFRNYDVDGVPPSEALYSFSVCGGFCAFDRVKLQQIGGFEALMSPFYWEDVELSYRAWKRGWVIHYEPRCLVFHDASTTIRGAFRRARIDRIDTRNRFIFMWKNLHDPIMLLIHLASTSLLIIQALLTVRFSFLMGLYDAIRFLPAIWRGRQIEKRAVQVKDRGLKKFFQDFKKKEYVLLR